ncbi:MAG: electron transfer flavoprotein subunit alpha/FixB family protein [Burkholderiales bacterium]|jgi:electron transfer flavoprotein alpha subunit|nr:electron transfer flavoprotein subunit alpha/FixB family protein [Burkholderiales bacterium]
MIKALVLAECAGNQIRPQTYSVVTAMKSRGYLVELLIASDNNIKELAEEAARIDGVHKVITVSAPYLYSWTTKNIVAQILTVLAREDYRVFAISSGFAGKRIAPYLAGKLNGEVVSDVVAFLDNDTLLRPVYSGSLLTVEKIQSKPLCVTIRSGAFAPAAQLSSPTAVIEALDATPIVSRVQYVERHCKNEDGQNRLTRARVVVGFGAGVDKEVLPIIFRLAEKLNAAVGATRAAVEAGLAPAGLLLGQTGKTVTPDLYIAVGISGAIQHVAGIKDSKTIVAINNDQNAPIFDIADYFWVADAHVAVLQLIEAL